MTAESFAPYGDVIEIRDGLDERVINYGHTTSYFDVADIDTNRSGGRPLVRLFRTQPVTRPIKVRMLERHPLGSQLFMPLSDRPWLVVVARPGDFDPASLRVFLADAGQGVNFRAGVWHHFSLALDEASDFLVIDRQGPGNNLDEIDLAPADQIVIDV